MSPTGFLGKNLEKNNPLLAQAYSALARFGRRKHRPAKEKNAYYRPSLDSLEERFMPATILAGNQIILGINDGGSFVTTDDQGNPVGLKFGGQDFLAPGVPLGGFSISVNNQSYFNYANQIGLPGTLVDISTPGTLAYRFTSDAIPGLLITREISMPQDSRQILISMTFQNTSNSGSQPRTFSNIATMEIDDPDPNGFTTSNDVIQLGNGILARGNSDPGLTFGLFSQSPTAYASILGDENGVHLTDSDPFKFLPSPTGSLTPGAGDPNGQPEDYALRLADSISTLAPGQSATFHSTILLGIQPGQVDTAAQALASNHAPTSGFDPLTNPRNTPVSTTEISFSQPVVGLGIEDFSLTLNGAPVSLDGVTLVPLAGGNGTRFRLDGLSAHSGADGEYRLSVVAGANVRDLAGRSLAQAPVLTWSMDITPPAPPVFAAFSPDTGESDSDFLTNASQIVLVGYAEPGARVDIAQSGGASNVILATSQADATGKWQVTISTANLKQGAVNLLATATDAGGNVSSGSAFGFRLDLSAPALPGLPSIVEDTGASQTDKITNDSTPTLAGTAEAGSLVQIQMAGIGNVGTVRANEDGTWRLSWPESLANLADGVHRFEVVSIDAAGNRSEARAFEVTVDTVAPAGAGIDAAIPGLIATDGDFLSNGQSVVLAGMAEAGATVTLNFDQASLGSVVVDGQGRWSMSVNLGQFSDGSHALRLIATDTAGNTAVGAGTNIVIDTVAPPAPKILAIANDTGRSGTDAMTRDPMIVLSGVAEPGAVVEVSVAGEGVVGTVRALENGTWSLQTSSSAAADGLHRFTARAIDRVGNTSSFATTFEVLVDTAAPPAPIIRGVTPDTGLPGDGITAGPELAIYGDAEPYSIVEIGLVGAGFLGSVTTDGSGHWSFELAGTTLADGNHQFTAHAVDIAGNTSSQSDSFQLVLDTTPPGKPAIISITGDADGDLIGNDNTPDIQGTAEAGSMVEVSLAGMGVIGQVRADSFGNWTLAWTPSLGKLSEGTHQLSAVATDTAGNHSLASPIFQVLVDTLAPDVPIISKIDPDTGKDGSDRVTSATIPSLVGSAEPGSTVTLRQIEKGWVVQVLAGADGTWRADFSAFGKLGEGNWTFSATATDVAGNTSGLAQGFTVLVDTVPPVVPGFAGLLGDTGRDAADRVTSDRTPGLAGNAEAGSTVIISRDDQEIGRVEADANGHWTLNLDDQPLDEGLHRFRFRSEDRAGNVSDWSTPVQVTIDTTTPAPVTAMAIAPITGTNGQIPLVNSRTVSLGGLAEGDATIEVMLDGNTVGSLVTSTGAWNLLLGNALGEGVHTAQVRVIDRAGNSSAWSSYSFGVDVTPPPAPVVGKITPDTGAKSDDRLTNANRVALSGTAEPYATLQIRLDGLVVGSVTTNSKGGWEYALANNLADGKHLVQATATDRAGNQSTTAGEMTFTVDTAVPNAPTILSVSPDSGVDGDGLVNSRAITLRGKAEAYATVELFIGNTPLGQATANANGDWSVSVSKENQALLAEGSNRIKARATDLAGNTSVQSADFDLRLDTQKPDQPSLVRIEADTGLPGDLLTSDVKPLFVGKAEPFSTVQIYLSETLLGTSVTDGQGNWSFRPSSDLPLGNNPVRFRAIDVAGNFGDYSATVNIQINTDIPPVPVILGFSPNTGSESDWITSAGNLTLRGTAKPGTTVDILVGGTVVGQTTPNSNGFWNFSVPGNLAAGTYRIQARSTSQSGLESAISETAIIEVDNTAPATPIIDAVIPDTGATAGDLVTGSSSLILKGRAEAGSVVEIRLGNLVVGTVVADAQGRWVLPLGDNLADKLYQVSARSTDAAGNQSDWSTDADLVVDTRAPVVTINAPAAGGIFNDTTWSGGIKGSVARESFESNIASVIVTLKDADTGKWFDGTSFSSATPVSLNARLIQANGRVDWVLDLPSSKLADSHGYQVTASATDLAGNEAENIVRLDFRYDLNPPTVTITPSANGVSLNFAPLVLDLRFSETVTGLDPTDFILPGGGSIVSISGEKDHWIVTMQPGPTGGSFTAKFSGSGIADLAGNHSADASIAFRVDVGDTKETALGIVTGANGQFSFNGSFDSANPADWFQLPLPAANQAFEVRLGGVTAPALAQWFDVSGKLLASAKAAAGADGVLRIQPSDGARFLRIQPLATGVALSQSGTQYALSINPIAGISDPQGNTQGQAQLLMLTNNAFSTSGERLTLGDADYIKITATSTGYIDATASPDSDSRLKSMLIAYDSRGKVISLQAPGEHGDSAKVRFPVIAGREYYLRVDGNADENGLGGTGKWTLAGQFTPSADAANALSGTGDAIHLDASGNATSRGTVDSAGDGDLFVLNVDGAGNYLIRMNPRITSGDLVPRILVVGENFQLVQQATGSAGAALTANVHLDHAGTYYFRLAAGAGTTGSFDVTIQSDDVGADDATAGGFSAANETQKAAGSIDLAGDTDLFRYVATKSGLYQVVLKSQDGSAGQFGYAAAVGSIPSSGASASVGKVFVEIGQTVYLRVDGINGATGQYQLELTPTADDHSDLLDPTRATSVQTGATVSGNLESFGDKDVFLWTAPTDPAALPPYGTYFASARADAGQTVDTYLTVYRVNADGSVEKISEDNDSFLGTDAVVFFQATLGTRYLFELKGAHDFDAGTYKFKLAEDRLEEGDDNPSSFQLARIEKSLQLDQMPDLKLTGVIRPETDLDIFRFVPTQSGPWILRADAISGGTLDPYLSLYDSSYSEIASDDNSGPGSGALILGNLVAGKEYFLSVSSTAGIGGYQLQALPFKTNSQIANDDFPADKAGAIAAPTSGATSQSGSIDFAGDTDLFTLNWPATVGNATLIARLDPGAKSGVDPYLEVIDASGKVLFSSDNTGASLSSSIVFDIDPGQTLFLRASGANKSLGNYNLSLESITQPASDDHPGSPNAGNLQTISLTDTSSQNNTTVQILSGTISGKIDQLGDRDFVKVVAPIDGYLTVNYVHDKGEFLNPYLRAYLPNTNGPGLVQVAGDDNSYGGIDSKIQLKVKAGQEVYLLATGAGGTTGSYTIQSVIAPDDIGDLPSTAQTLRLEGLRAQAGGNLETGSDTDMFIYQPSVSGSITVRLHALSGGLNPYLFVYQQKDGALITSNNDLSQTNRDSQVQLQVVAGETYYLSARSAGNTTGEYSLEVVPVMDDFPSSIDAARRLSLAAGNVGGQVGKIEAIGDSDWFRIIPGEDGILRVSLAGIDGANAVDPTLAIYNDAGQLIGMSDDTVSDGIKSTSSDLSVVGRAGRSYFIRAMGYGESTGSYQLTVQAGTSVSDDYGDTVDTADLIQLDDDNMAEFDGSLGAADQDVIRFIASGTGEVTVNYTGNLGQLRVVLRENGETLQLASGNFNGKPGSLRFRVTEGQEIFLIAQSPEDTKILGGDFKASIKLVEGAASSATPVSSDIVSALDTTLTQSFTQLIGMGESQEDFYKIRDQITQQLIASLKAAAGGTLGTSYLLIWLDPVDFVVTDSASQQIGNRGSQGAINENSSAALSQKGVLDLVVIPGAQASSYSMQLFGVGGGRVLAGATMVQADGTVINPRVTVNGSSVDTGVPVGSVPKEGLTLSLDFRGEQTAQPPTTTPEAVASVGNAAQQIVNSLLSGMVDGADSVGDLALVSGDLAMTDLVTLLVGAGTDFNQFGNDGQRLDPPVWETQEAQQLISIVRNFALEIHDSFAKGLRLIAEQGPLPAEEVLALLKNSLMRLGFDQAEEAVEGLGEDAQELLTRVLGGELKTELVNKPMKQFWTGLLKELDKTKIGKTITPAAAKESQANAEAKAAQTNAEDQAADDVLSGKADQARGGAKENTPAKKAILPMPMARPAGEDAEGSEAAFGLDEVWVDGFGVPFEGGQVVIDPEQSPEEKRSSDQLWGMVAAAMLIPSWVSSGPVGREKKPKRPLGFPGTGSGSGREKEAVS